VGGLPSGPVICLGGELDAEPKIGFSELSLPEKAPLLATS
jgi:hypothetical protein